MARNEIEKLVAMLDEAYAGPAWHGPCLRGSLRGVTPGQALWRPAPGRHNIWELAVHAAYWKYAVRRQLLGLKQGSFVEEGSNWFERGPRVAGGAAATAWRRGRAVLAREHEELRATVLPLGDSLLDFKPPGSRHTRRRMIAGVAFHDVYHAGQIQLVKRLAGTR
ncbi:MAG TPA: DinB family protein [Terriglobia bacterium]|nr:DinB family protein [Terriglobia bacterium]